MSTIRTDVNCGNMCFQLYRLAEQRGISHDEVIAQIKADYGVTSSKDLTLEQYKKLKKQIACIPRPKAESP